MRFPFQMGGFQILYSWQMPQEWSQSSPPWDERIKGLPIVLFRGMGWVRVRGGCRPLPSPHLIGQCSRIPRTVHPLLASTRTIHFFFPTNSVQAEFQPSAAYPPCSWVHEGLQVEGSVTSPLQASTTALPHAAGCGVKQNLLKLSPQTSAKTMAREQPWANR